MPSSGVSAAFASVIADLPVLAGFLWPGGDGRVAVLNSAWDAISPNFSTDNLGMPLRALLGIGDEQLGAKAVEEAIRTASDGENVELQIDIFFNNPFRERALLRIKPVGGGVSSPELLLFTLDQRPMLSQEDSDVDEQLRLFLMATKASQTGVWSLDTSTMALTWSDVHKQLWGYPEDASFLTYEDWHTPILEEDREGTFEQVQKAKEERSVYIAEYRIRRVSDGAIRWMRSKGLYRYNAKGEATKMLGVSYDITVEKETNKILEETENRFRKTLTSIPDGYMLFEALRDERGEIYDFRWLHINPAAESVVQRLAEDLVGKRLLIEMPGSKERGLFDVYKKVVETGELFEAQIEYPQNGVKHFFQNKAIKINDGFAVFFSDITLNKRFEKELEHQVKERTAELEALNEQLINSNMELENYAFITSHDLQEPLRKIEMFSSLLLSSSADDLTEKNRSYLERIAQASSRMRLLIDTLLRFSKINHQSEEWRLVDLNEKFRVTQSMLEVIIEEKGPIIDIEPGLPQVYGVPNLILMVLLNVFSNSLKFIRPGLQPEISACYRHADALDKELQELASDKNYVVISIQDNGIGFDKANEKLIFNMFKRLKHIDEYEGTGMGLALCARIMKQHGGAIAADTTPGQGTRIDLYFPYEASTSPQ